MLSLGRCGKVGKVGERDSRQKDQVMQIYKICVIQRGVQGAINNPERLEYICIVAKVDSREFPGIIKQKSL